MLLDLSERPPEWLPPATRPAAEQSQQHLDSVVESARNVTAEQVPSLDYHLTRTRLWGQIMERRNRWRAQETEFNRQLLQWNPHKDPNVKGDAHSTLFLARLPYDVTEEQITEEFSKYGPIESIRIVTPKRGYAFVLYKSENGPENAVSAVQQTAGGMLFKDRRIITDLERGRLQMGWRPRRLGGGLGGRLSVARQTAEIARANQIMRKGVRLPQHEGRKRSNDVHNHNPAHSLSQASRRGPFNRNSDTQRQDFRDHRYTKRLPPVRNQSGREYTGRDQTRRNGPRRDQPGGGGLGGGARPGDRVLRQY